jgi:hypothetical protein
VLGLFPLELYHPYFDVEFPNIWEYLFDGWFCQNANCVGGI